jgi:hypothetical protein
VFVHQPSRTVNRPDLPAGGRRLLDLADWDLRGIYSDFY